MNVSVGVMATNLIFWRDCVEVNNACIGVIIM